MTYSFSRTADLLRLPVSTGEGAGLRHAQIAAAHAVAAHFWAAHRPAIVVMPTGSGKTAVMVLVSILLRATRVLVIAPSRLLREQLVEKFSKLEPLRRVGALDEAADCPVVIEQAERVDTLAAWNAMASAHVVVALPHSASPGIEGVAAPPADLFDVVLVDEAHHIPARIYRALAEAFPAAKCVLFTATPFRRDEREIPGDLVFTYHLAQARRDGVFGQLEFVPVKVAANASQRKRDEAIARAASRRLGADRRSGFDHRLLVRASSKDRADELGDVYSAVTSLKLKRIHSGLSQKWVQRAVEELRSGQLDGVITVDMLGEGFDLPNLKVAALHSRHRSLAVTLQFIGRFARTSTDLTLGSATFFAIPSEIEPDAEGLYTPGAEWNEIVESLSRDQIEGEAQAREFARSFARPARSASHVEGDTPEEDDLTDDDAARLLRTVKPYFHVKVYDALAVPDLEASILVPPSLVPILTRRSAKHNAVIWIGREQHVARWTTHPAWVDVAHEMFLIVHVPEHSLLFVCSSRRENSVYDGLVGSVLGDQHRRLATSEVNRVLRGISSPEFFSLGLKNRAGASGGGGESYQMRAGRSAARSVRAADSALYSQGHAFCRGDENGKPTTIGFSSSSKLWANRRDGLDQFVDWMHALSLKLRDSTPVMTGSGLDKLGVARRIEHFDAPVVAGDLAHDAYTRRGSRVTNVGGAEPWLVDFAVRIDGQSGTSVEFSLFATELELRFKTTLARTPLITAASETAANAMLRGEGVCSEDPLIEYLNTHPPALYLATLARVDGDEQQDPPRRDGPAVIAEQIRAIDWRGLGVDPFREKPANGRSKLKSLFEYVEGTLMASAAELVFLDDGAGEIADYVSMTPEADRVCVELFHCKAASKESSAKVPNQQISNLYEVIGQAIKCRRYLEPRRLVEQLEHRQTLQHSRFCIGDIDVAKKLLADPTRVVFEVVVVQPSLSTEPSEAIARLLEAADAYMRGGDQVPLVFWGTQA